MAGVGREAALRQHRRLDAGACRVAGMQRLRHRSHVAAKAARAAARDADRGRGVVWIEAQQPACGHRRRDRAHQPHVPPAPVGRPAFLTALEIDGLGQPRARLIGEDESVEHLLARQAAVLRDRERRRENMRRKMRAVVEIERIGERAIGKRGHRRRGLDAGAENRRGRRGAGILGHMLGDDLADLARRRGKGHANRVQDHGLGGLDHAAFGDRLGRRAGHEGTRVAR